MRKLALTALTWLCLAGCPQAFSQQLSDPNSISQQCIQDRVKCAYGKAIQAVATAYATSTKAEEKQDRLNEVIVVERVPEHFILANATDVFWGAFENVVNAQQQARVDKMLGPAPRGQGATDLVSRPSTSELLGLGVQVGALTETVSGSVATFQANAGGAYRAIIGAPAICADCLPRWSLNNLNFLLAFNLNAPGSQTLTTAGPAVGSSPAPTTIVLPQSSRQFSSVTVRYNLSNPLDPRSEQFQKAWKAAYDRNLPDLQAESAVLMSALSKILTPLIKDKQYSDLQKEYGPKFQEAAPKGVDELFRVLREYLDRLKPIVRADVPDLDKKVAVAVASYARYSQLNYDTVLEARGSQFTAEYVYSRPQSQPETHDFRLIVGLNPKRAASGALFTLNFAGSIYGGTIPAGAHYGRFRDFQFAAQFDRSLGNLITHPATLTLAGYVQYQFDPSVLNIGPGNLVPGTGITLPQDAKVLLGTSGTLGIIQGKVTMTTKSGLKIPIGISWANKTNLLDATDVRGHVGITYDFDSIGQLFGQR